MENFKVKTETRIRKFGLADEFNLLGTQGPANAASIVGIAWGDQNRSTIFHAVILPPG